jgi:hypothetical protein
LNIHKPAKHMQAEPQPPLSRLISLGPVKESTFHSGI